MFFYYKKSEILKGKCYVVYQSEKKLTEDEMDKINKIHNNLLIDTIIDESEEPFMYYPILEDKIIRPATEKELVKLGIVKLREGEKIENDKIIKVEKPNGVKIQWNYETLTYEEKATEDEITEFIGNLVTTILYDVLTIGCEVIIQGKKHQQSLEKSKREALDEQVGGINLAEELNRPITTIMWPFRDDGTDTVIMSTDEFEQMVLDCHKYGQNCYIAAELLKAKRNINSTIDDFYTELTNIDVISLENL